MRAALALTVLLLASCQTSPFPAAMPDDFAVSVYEGGGMIQYSRTLEFSGHGSRFQKNFNNQAKADFSFASDPKDLEVLYKSLVENQFDRITSHDEKIYDRSSYSVTVTAAGRTFAVSDGGMSVVDLNWVEKWKAVNHAVRALEAQSLKKHGCRLTFLLSDNLKGVSNLYLGLDFASIYDPDSKTTQPPSVSVFPGDYVFSAGADQTIPYQRLPLKVNGSRTYDVNFDGDQISISPER